MYRCLLDIKIHGVTYCNAERGWFFFFLALVQKQKVCIWFGDLSFSELRFEDEGRRVYLSMLRLVNYQRHPCADEAKEKMKQKKTPAANQNRRRDLNLNADRI